MNHTTEELGISERVLQYVISEGKEVTPLDVSKHFELESGTNLILDELFRKGLIERHIERNGTRKYSYTEPQ